jgi:phospholipase/carboxylesterase
MRQLLFILICLTHIVCAQKTAKEVPLIYKVREPKVAMQQQPPMLLLLHGYGSNADDLFSLAAGIDERFLVISVQGSYKLAEGSFAWYSLDFNKNPYTSNNEEAEKSRVALGEFISAMLQRYKADPKKVYLLGFSQGAMMSLSCALTMPQKVAGAVVLSGKLREEIKPLVAPEEQLKSLNIYIAHGKKDVRVPFREAEKANAYLTGKGINTTFKILPNDAHQISQECYDDFRKWLAEKIKPSYK